MAYFVWMVIDEMLNFSKFPKMSGFVGRLCITNHKYAFNIIEIVRVNFTAQKPQRFSYEDHLLSVITENNKYKAIETNEYTLWSVRRFLPAAHVARLYLDCITSTAAETV